MSNISNDHYQKLPFQPIDFMGCFDGMGFNEGNIIKYISRYKYKNQHEDLVKAIYYLDRLANNPVNIVTDESESYTDLVSRYIIENQLNPMQEFVIRGLIDLSGSIPSPFSRYLIEAKKAINDTLDVDYGQGLMIYVSGKITGLDIKIARKNFLDACDEITSTLPMAGYLDPMAVYLGYGASHDRYMEIDLYLMEKYCNAIYMQSNYKESKGALMELDKAKKLGFHIIYQSDKNNK